jgi:hypothetical protein
LTQGVPAAALEYLREVGGRLELLAAQTIYALTSRLRGAEAQQALGHVDEALDESRVAVEIARRFAAASSLGAAPRIRGRLAGDEEAPDDAVGRLCDAPARLELARALTDFGAMVRRRGARRDYADHSAPDKTSRLRARRTAWLRRREASRRQAASTSNAATSPVATSSSLASAGSPRWPPKAPPTRRSPSRCSSPERRSRCTFSNAYRKLGIRWRRDLSSAPASFY